ncbi:MAG: guanylate kinase [Thermoguttaceae bacterium]
MADSSRGRLVVISGPSGVGKTTVLERLFERCDLPLVRSVSATTRPPRPGETDGVDYHFLTHDDFCRRRQAGEFIECFEVFGQGDWYGTLVEEVSPSLRAGKWVVLGIDIRGAAAVVARHPETITIFLRPGSLEVLEKRLRGRRTETEESLQRRLQQARTELAAADQYQYQVINDDLDQAVQEICDLLASQEND